MTRWQTFIAACAAGATIAAAGLAQAQFAAGGMAPPGAINDLAGAPVGGGFGGAGSGFDPLGRARGAAGQAGGMAGYPGGYPGGEMGGYPGAYPGAYPGGMPGGLDPQTMAQMPELETVNAIVGKRVTCRVTKQLLEDPRRVEIGRDFRDEYFEDELNGDEVYIKVEKVDDLISPEAHLVLSRALIALDTAENMPTLDFTATRVATTDVPSRFPHLLNLEEERDVRLRDWADRFLRDFRVDPDAPGADSWTLMSTYLPAPPRTPTMAIPGDFIPPEIAEEIEAENERESGGGGYEGGGYPMGPPGGGGPGGGPY